MRQNVPTLPVQARFHRWRVEDERKQWDGNNLGIGVDEAGLNLLSLELTIDGEITVFMEFTLQLCSSQTSRAYKSIVKQSLAHTTTARREHGIPSALP